MPDIVLSDTCHSSRSFNCRADGCNAKLWLQQALPEGWGLTGGHIESALAAAARVLGWESDRCPRHLDAMSSDEENP
jgi:hypothetical protein